MSLISPITAECKLFPSKMDTECSNKQDMALTSKGHIVREAPVSKVLQWDILCATDMVQRMGWLGNLHNFISQKIIKNKI